MENPTCYVIFEIYFFYYFLMFIRIMLQIKIINILFLQLNISVFSNWKKIFYFSCLHFSFITIKLYQCLLLKSMTYTHHTYFYQIFFLSVFERVIKVNIFVKEKIKVDVWQHMNFKRDFFLSNLFKFIENSL